MCCDGYGAPGLPPAVAEALAHHRRLQRERPGDWGDDRIDLFRWARFARLGPVVERFGETGDWATAVRDVVGDEPPAGIVLIRVGADGEVDVRTGPARPVVAGRTTAVDVVVASAADDDVTVAVSGRSTPVPARGAAVRTVDVDGLDPVIAVAHRGQTVAVTGAVEVLPATLLRVSAPTCARWSVTDATGGAWFPDDVPPKWDALDRPWFHGHDTTFVVPAAPLGVTCARGLEFDVVERRVTPGRGVVTAVSCAPDRLFDPAAAGWYGGDLHVHLNYGGDWVVTLDDAARMQRGEGLHVLNLAAGNCQTSLIYDRDLLEATVGSDLSWSGGDVVARAGVEYRNDLLGHVIGFGPGAPPGRWYAGHERSDHPHDWPPNAVACEELQGIGATVTAPHPAFSPFGDDWSTDAFFATPRSVEARELVADAALGLVDAIDLVSPADDGAATFLYHRLLSCGLRLAATAGTDVFLSFAHGPGVASNPPGWGRVYADLRGRPLSVPAFQDAVRDGRTVVTNGPWIELAVDGHGPGAVLDRARGAVLTVTARIVGPGADVLALVGPEGVIAERTDGTRLEVALAVDGPLWIAALARGGPHPRTPGAPVFAHTSPVHVEVDGGRVARAADARWCLGFLDRVEDLAREHGRFAPDARDGQLADLVAVLDRARAVYRDVLARAPQEAW